MTAVAESGAQGVRWDLTPLAPSGKRDGYGLQWDLPIASHGVGPIIPTGMYVNPDYGNMPIRFVAITSGLGQIGLFAGLVAALWRANLATGVSDTGIRGLGLGLAGVGMLSLFEIALIVDWVRIASPLTELTQSPALDAGIITGTAVVFAGLAALGVGLARAVDLFGRSRAAAAPPPVSRSEEPS